MKEKFDENKKYFGIALTVFLVIAASIVLFFIIYRWRNIADFFLKIIGILSPILYGIVIAYILTPLIGVLEEKVFNKLSKKIFKKKYKKYAPKFSRFMSLFVAIIIMLALLAGIVMIVIPEILNSIDGLIKNIPTYFNGIKNFLDNSLSNSPDLKEILINNVNSISESLSEWINSSAIPNMDTIIVNISTGVIGVIKSLANIIIGIIIAIYILNGKEKFISQSKKILFSIVKPEQANVVMDNVRHVHKIFGGFLLGKVIDSLIIGIICFVFMYIFKMPYAVLISVIIGVTNIIPYFGPFIGAIPSAILILIISPSKCLTFVIFIFILQQFDGNILGPAILGGKTGLKSFWVLFAILVFGGLFGFVGMIIGVPLFAVIYAFINGLISRRLDKQGLPTATVEYENLKEINPKTKKAEYFK